MMIEAQEKRRQEQLHVMRQLIRKPERNEQAIPITACVFPEHSAFDSGTGFWTDYWVRFYSFVEVNSVPEGRKHTYF